MKLKQIKYFLFFSLILNGIIAMASCDGDTIRLKPSLVSKKPYHPQPLILKTNPLAILWGPIPFTSEYRMVAEITTGRTQSTQVGISIFGTSPLWKAIEKAAKVPSYYQLKIRGWRIQASHKFYLISRRRYAPFGFYVSPLVSYSNARISLQNYKQNYFEFSHFNANILIGVQLGRNTKLTIDIFGGLGYKENTVFYHINSYRSVPYSTKDFGDLYNSPVKATFGINFGYAIY